MATPASRWNRFNVASGSDSISTLQNRGCNEVVMIDKSALEGMLGTNEKMDIERTVVKTCLGDGVTEMYDIWLARRGDDIQVGPREAGEAGCLGGVLLRKRHVEENAM